MTVDFYSPEPAFYIAGGTLDRDAPCYVSRQADADLLEGLRQGQFCYVLTSRQMGKSSLMVRATQHLRDEGVAVAVLDLTALGQNVSADQWYFGLLRSLAEQLDIEELLLDYWRANKEVGPLRRFLEALREVVLELIQGPVVILIDEVDAVRSLTFPTDELFAGIRECYNRRAEHPKMQRLTFGLFGVASPSDLIRDTRVTPFNIGRRIELKDFTPVDASVLAQGLSEDGRDGKHLLLRVLFWTGGHPYLTQRLCQALAIDLSADTAAAVDTCCTQMFFTARSRENEDNLLFVSQRLLESGGDRSSLLDLYGRVRSGRKVVDDETSRSIAVLRLSGIVRAEQGLLKVRNRIYEQVFDRNWLRAHSGALASRPRSLDLAQDGAGDVKVSDRRGRVTLGDAFAGKMFSLYALADGAALLVPASSGAERDNPAASNSLAESAAWLETLQRAHFGPSGWDGSGTPAPASRLIAAAREVLALLQACALAGGQSWEDPRIASSECGQISLEWRRDSRSVTVFIRSEDRVEYLKTWAAPTEAEREEGEVSRVADFVALSHWLYQQGPDAPVTLSSSHRPHQDDLNAPALAGDDDTLKDMVE